MVRFWDIRKKTGVKAITGFEKECEVADIEFASSHDFLVASGKKVTILKSIYLRSICLIFANLILL